jgi:hypothetical protein
MRRSCCWTASMGRRSPVDDRRVAEHAAPATTVAEWRGSHSVSGLTSEVAATRLVAQGAGRRDRGDRDPLGRRTQRVDRIPPGVPCREGPRLAQALATPTVSVTRGGTTQENAARSPGCPWRSARTPTRCRLWRRWPSERRAGASRGSGDAVTTRGCVRSSLMQAVRRQRARADHTQAKRHAMNLAILPSAVRGASSARLARPRRRSARLAARPMATGVGGGDDRPRLTRRRGVAGAQVRAMPGAGGLLHAA